MDRTAKGKVRRTLLSVLDRSSQELEFAGNSSWFHRTVMFSFSYPTLLFVYFGLLAVVLIGVRRKTFTVGGKLLKSAFRGLHLYLFVQVFLFGCLYPLLGQQDFSSSES